MSTLVDVANDALTEIGYGKTLGSIESTDQETRDIRALLYRSIRQIQEQFPWQECVKTVTLNATLPVDELGRRKFQRPADLIKALDPSPSEYETQENLIVVPFDVESITLRYIYLNLNPATWSVGLANCITTRLAAYLCFALLKNMGMRKELENELYGRILPRAKFDQSESNTNTKQQDYSSPLANIRNGGLYHGE